MLSQASLLKAMKKKSEPGQLGLGKAQRLQPSETLKSIYQLILFSLKERDHAIKDLATKNRFKRVNYASQT